MACGVSVFGMFIGHHLLAGVNAMDMDVIAKRRRLWAILLSTPAWEREKLAAVLRELRRTGLRGHRVSMPDVITEIATTFNHGV